MLHPLITINFTTLNVIKCETKFWLHILLHFVSFLNISKINMGIDTSLGFDLMNYQDNYFPNHEENIKKYN